ncbi:MAG TPA: isochorismatase family cysteine hydrolase [Rhizomicrobium sp.]|jgi:nicotinamidase-related amidase|nr:isochorismatase family cysteine hydrolase [Rhizomicrobium sp.]
MALTQIDPVAALVVIDLQKGIAGLPLAHPTHEIVARTAELLRAFRARNLPVVLVNVAGRPPGRTDVKMEFTPPPDWTDLVPELDRQPGDHLVTKMNIGAFYGTALERILRRHHATQIFLTGVATSVGVETTAREAFDYGYNVVTVVDAMTDRDADTHRYTLEKVFPRISETTTTAQLLALLK